MRSAWQTYCTQTHGQAWVTQPILNTFHIHSYLPTNLDGISAFGSSHEAVYMGKRWNACRYHKLTTLHLGHTAHSDTLKRSRKGCYSRTASKGDLLNYKIQLPVLFPVFQEQTVFLMIWKTNGWLEDVRSIHRKSICNRRTKEIVWICVHYGFNAS